MSTFTRRDFCNASLLGSGTALLGASPPGHDFSAAEFDGPTGVGDYARSNGNPLRVLEAAHRIRDGAYSAENLEAVETGEVFDLVVVGGGMSGLGAALAWSDGRKDGESCLILDNHPIFGGESKRNEFRVGGHRLMAPQGANEFDVPTDPAEDAYEIFERLRIPRSFEYARLPAEYRSLEFDRTNYGFKHWIHAASFGNRVDGEWVRNFWSEHASDELKTWKFDRDRYADREDRDPWLDSMTYKEYVERVMGLSPAVTSYADPILASAMGLGCDALSAYAAYQIGLPGFRGANQGSEFPLEFDQVPETGWHMFPGGNTGLARYIVKALIPKAINGSRELNSVINGRVRFDQLDRRGAPVRIRVSATVVRVEQNEERVAITYETGGRLRRVLARGVVMACGSWVSRHIVQGLPDEKREAFRHFSHSAVLTANVAVRHWRFLYDRGLTAARWNEGFGFACNVRPPMLLPDYKPAFGPDDPTVLTFYVPLYYPGMPAADQGRRGRAEMLSTSFADYESRIREQMRKLFGAEAERAIAGIILNRWGHAYVNPTPGFYFGRDGAPAPPDVIRKPMGRITFAHSELFGHQFWLGAIREGVRAVKQLDGIS